MAISIPSKSRKMCDFVAIAAIPAIPFGSLNSPDLRRSLMNKYEATAAVMTRLEVRARDQTGTICTRYFRTPGPDLGDHAGFRLKLMDGFCREGAIDVARMFPMEEKKTANCLSFKAVIGTK